MGERRPALIIFATAMREMEDEDKARAEMARTLQKKVCHVADSLDIELITGQTGCTPEEAARAFTRNHGDIVDTILELTPPSDEPVPEYDDRVRK